MAHSRLSKPNRTIRLAISTCPNDTFAFHAILERKIGFDGLDFDIQLLDIQQLNEGLRENRFDVAKASFHAAAHCADRTIVLPSGSAIGFGVGPLLLAAHSGGSPNAPISGIVHGTNPVSASPAVATRSLCPGDWTTATMLFRMFYGDAIDTGKTKLEHCCFSEIMPALISKQAEFGVCIHEGRFTWKQEGLFLVEDLGTRWENETNSPLPLGGILARRELGDELIGRIQSVIRASIEYGLCHRNETLMTMRTHAQELNDDVLFQHVDLYVNDWTIDLGDVGRKAIQTLSAKARECGLTQLSKPEFQDDSGIEIWSPNLG